MSKKINDMINEINDILVKHDPTLAEALNSVAHIMMESIRGLENEQDQKGCIESLEKMILALKGSNG